MMKFAVNFGHPIAIRYPRGTAFDGLKEYRAPIVLGKSELIYKEKEIALIAVGSMVKTALEVREELVQKGYSVSLVNARFVKPIDENMVKALCKDHKLLVTMEENVASGGFGEKVRDYLQTLDTDAKVLSIALPDAYVEHGNVDILRKEVGIDNDSIIQKVTEKYKTIYREN